MTRIAYLSVIITLIAIGVILKFKFLYYLAILSLVLNFCSLNYLIAQEKANVWMIGFFIIGSISVASFFHHSVYFVYSLIVLFYARFVFIYGYEKTINRKLICSTNQTNRDIISENIIMPLLIASTMIAFLAVLIGSAKLQDRSLMELSSNKFTLKDFIKDPFDHSIDKNINEDIDRKIMFFKKERMVRSIRCGDLDLDCYTLKIELIKRL